MNQLRILHLSDIHFGKNHRCGPEDPTHAKDGYSPLFELIREDLEHGPFEHPLWHDVSRRGQPLSPLLVLVSGDLTEQASADEFRSVHQFLERFEGATILGTKLTKKDIFVVPGNHDVNYLLANAEDRLSPYSTFYSKFFRGVRPPVAPDEARNFTQVHVDKERGFLIAEIDSALHVQKGTPDEQRGQVDMMAVAKLRRELETVRQSGSLDSLIRIALLHHHPVLVPALVEPGRGYDAVANSHYLLQLLRDFGFHLVLHGHKHYPLVFSYDSDSPWNTDTAPSMLIAAGGSTGSRELPRGLGSCNSYNLLSLKWHPEAAQARVRFETRGLLSSGDSGELAPDLWKWKTLRSVDRRLFPPVDPPSPVAPAMVKGTYQHENIRGRKYAETKLNMVVSEVLPSLLPEQAYEIRLWVVPHADITGKPKVGWVAPEKVVWSAGPMFPIVECNRADDNVFACSLSYWGPMLVQAEMFFADGSSGFAHTYARIPGLAASREISSGGSVSPQ